MKEGDDNARSHFENALASEQDQGVHHFFSLRESEQRRLHACIRLSCTRESFSQMFCVRKLDIIFKINAGARRPYVDPLMRRISKRYHGYSLEHPPANLRRKLADDGKFITTKLKKKSFCEKTSPSLNVEKSA